MAVPRLLNGRYEVRRLLQAGRVTRVYDGYDLQEQRRVAIEVLREVFATDHAAATRFDQAVRKVTRLDHPNIGRVTDGGQVEGVRFLIREPIDGLSVRDLLARDGPMPPDEAAATAAAASAALAHAHVLEQVHGGLTPADLHIGPAGEVKVTGFGLADCVGTAEGLDARYVAPNLTPVAQSDSTGGDLYALGACLHDMLAGLRSTRGGPLRSADVARLDAPPELRAIVERLVGSRTDQPYTDAPSVRQALAGLADPLSPPWGNGDGESGALHQEDDPAERLPRFLKRPILVFLGCGVAAVVVLSASMVNLGPGQTVRNEEARGQASEIEIVPQENGSRRQSGGMAPDVTAQLSTTEPTTTTEPDEAAADDHNDQQEDGDGGDGWEDPNGGDDSPPGGESPDQPAPAPPTTATPTTTAPPTSTTTQPPPSPVPSVVGLHRNEAASALGGQGLNMAVVRRVCDNGRVDRVLSQTPGAGEPRPSDGSVGVTLGRWCLFG